MHVVFRAGGTSGAGGAAVLPLFWRFTIGCPTIFLRYTIRYDFSYKKFAPPGYRASAGPGLSDIIIIMMEIGG